MQLSAADIEKCNIFYISFLLGSQVISNHFRLITKQHSMSAESPDHSGNGRTVVCFFFPFSQTSGLTRNGTFTSAVSSTHFMGLRVYHKVSYEVPSSVYLYTSVFVCPWVGFMPINEPCECICNLQSIRIHSCKSILYALFMNVRR